MHKVGPPIYVQRKLQHDLIEFCTRLGTLLFMFLAVASST